MGRCGNVVFCAMVLFSSSFISGDRLFVSSTSPLSQSLQTSVRRRDGVTEFTESSNPSGNQTRTPQTNSTAAGAPGKPENSSLSVNITVSRNESDPSPVNNQTAVTTVTPALPLPTTHKPKPTISPTSRPVSETAVSPKQTTAGPESPKTPTGPSSSLTEPAAPLNTSTSTHAPNTSTSTSTSTSTHALNTSTSTHALNTSTSTSTHVPNSSPARPRAHLDTPSALNRGDNDSNLKVTSDPVLAGLVSGFVVIAAVVSVLIFLKFRNRNDGPEFRRLQDLPMDDMLEDAPLSMYSY